METKQMFQMPFFVLSFLTNRKMLSRCFEKNASTLFRNKRIK